MKKVSPLVAAIIGAIILAAQQFVGKPDANLKVVGLAVVIAVLGVVSTFLKGKGASLLGIIGTVAYTFYDMYTHGNADFNWTQFILTAGIAALTVFAPTLIPQPEEGGSTIAKK